MAVAGDEFGVVAKDGSPLVPRRLEDVQLRGRKGAMCKIGRK